MYKIIQKLSFVIPCDSTGVFLIKTIHIYQHKYGYVGSFFKASIQETRPLNKLKKKKKIKNFFLRGIQLYRLSDNSWLRYNQNNSIILKKRLHARGKIIMGPCTYTIKRKKFLKSFVKLI